uniref:Ribosomal protein L2 n=1 Tax=Plectus sambesii TaxID=2011161 RepID=A0A914XIZ1_9BILA
MQKVPRQGLQGTKMKSQFNRQHGVRMHRFATGESAYARDYRTPSKPGWMPGGVIKRTGQVTFVVNVNGTSHVRHPNQLQTAKRAERLAATTRCSLITDSGRSSNAVACRAAAASITQRVHSHSSKAGDGGPRPHQGLLPPIGLRSKEGKKCRSVQTRYF